MNIKYRIVFLLIGWGILLTAGSLFAANTNQARFDQANRLYEEGKFSGALELYREIEKTEPHWKLFYNMGNCYYKSNELIRAKIYYLKARRLAPTEASILNNIEIVNRLINDKIPTVKTDFMNRVVMRIESFLVLDAVSVILILLILVLNGFIFLWIRHGGRRWIVYGISFSLVFVIVTGVYHYYRVEKFDDRNVGVVIKDNSQLRSGPGENNTVLFKVNPGLEVKIIEKSRNWIQISASSEIAGWIEAENVEQI